MILALLLLLQSPDTSTAITIRDGSATTSVPIVFARDGRLLRATQLLSPMALLLRKMDGGRYLITASGTEIELNVGVPFARIGKDATPLSSAPAFRQGELYLPLSLVTDVLPRVAAGYVFDHERSELRHFRAETAVRAPPPRATTKGGTAEAVPPGSPASTDHARRGKPREHVVIVDAGHGGPDRGMSGPIGARNRIYEADVTLQVSRLLRNALSRRGIKVVMTRDRDTLIALSDRGRIANRAQGDLFLSVHVNAANLRWRDPGGARGFETFFLAEAKTDDERRVADIENEAVKYEAESDAPAGDPLSFILNDMKQNEYLRESSELASTVQQSLRAVHPGSNRGVKQAGFRVLVTAFMPAVLVEIGFGSNRADADFISSDSGQRALADAMADAAVEYLTQYDRRGSAAGGRGSP